MYYILIFANSLYELMRSSFPVVSLTIRLFHWQYFVSFTTRIIQTHSHLIGEQSLSFILIIMKTSEILTQLSWLSRNKLVNSVHYNSLPFYWISANKNIENAREAIRYSSNTKIRKTKQVWSVKKNTNRLQIIWIEVVFVDIWNYIWDFGESLEQ